MKLDTTTTTTLGASLSRINQGFMKEGSEQGSERLWYQGNEPYFDIIVERQGEKITWFQATLRGRVVSWSHGQDFLYTGETDELDAEPEGMSYAASKGIQSSDKINWPLVQTIYDIVASRPDDPHLHQLSSLLKGHLPQGAVDRGN